MDQSTSICPDFCPSGRGIGHLRGVLWVGDPQVASDPHQKATSRQAALEALGRGQDRRVCKRFLPQYFQITCPKGPEPQKSEPESTMSPRGNGHLKRSAINCSSRPSAVPNNVPNFAMPNFTP